MNANYPIYSTYPAYPAYGEAEYCCSSVAETMGSVNNSLKNLRREALQE